MHPPGGGMGKIIDHSSSPQALPPNETRPPRTDDLRLMTLDVGGGAGNMVYESDGMDPGDVNELALRIANEGVDVAALQEVWKMDLPELERQLEHITGDDWDLHFAQ